MNRIYSSLGRRGLGGLWGGIHVRLGGVGWVARDGGRGWKGCCDDDVGEPLLFPYYSALILHPQSTPLCRLFSSRAVPICASGLHLVAAPRLSWALTALSLSGHVVYTSGRLCCLCCLSVSVSALGALGAWAEDSKSPPPSEPEVHKSDITP